MSKRFTDTEKWNDEWFQSMKPAYKCLWMYLCDKCDMAGVWKINRGLADYQIGEAIDWNTLFDKFGNRCILIKEDRMFVVGFIDFQYGKLNELSRPHQAVLKTLELHNITYPIDTLSIPYTKSMDTLKDKDKDKDKNKDKEKDKETSLKDSKETFLVPDHLSEIWPDYVQMRSRKKASNTTRAFRLIINELNKLTSDTTEQYMIVSQSIRSGWIDVYPLKDKSTKPQNQYGLQKLTQDVFEEQMGMKLE